jgi:hypothetical protein
MTASSMPLEDPPRGGHNFPDFEELSAFRDDLVLPDPTGKEKLFF